MRVPITKLMRRGKLNDELIELIMANVRLKDMVYGDIMANITCNEVGGRLLLEFMDEYKFDDLSELSRAIIGRTERAMRERLAAIPDGVYRNAIQVEGIDEPITLACAVNISGDEVHIDFEGTTPSIRRGINVPLCYTRAFSNYALKVLTIPELPNNEGAANPISISVPPGCILNALPPSSTGGRHVIGHFVAPLIFGALGRVLPDEVQADSGMLSQLSCHGRHRNGRGVSSLFFASGGFGALKGIDGRAATPGPSNMIGTPIEIWEHETSVSVLKKNGAGLRRPWRVPRRQCPGDPSAQRQRPPDERRLVRRPHRVPAARRAGRRSGATARDTHQRQGGASQRPLYPQAGRCLRDAGGRRRRVGDPRKRPPEQLLADVRNGDVTVEGALQGLRRGSRYKEGNRAQGQLGRAARQFRRHVMPRIIDLSVTIENNMPVHKNMPRPVYLQWGSHESSKANKHGVPEDPFTSAIEFMGMLNHVGTHVDAFYHLKPDGQTIDEMPIDMFMGKAVCFDLTHIPDLGDIDVNDMEQAEAKAGVKVDGHIVLLNTGLHRRHYPRDLVMHSNAGLRPRPRIGWLTASRRCTAWKARQPTDQISTSSPIIGSAATAASPTWSGCAISRSWSAKASSISRRFHSS